MTESQQKPIMNGNTQAATTFEEFIQKYGLQHYRNHPGSNGLSEIDSVLVSSDFGQTPGNGPDQFEIYKNPTGTLFVTKNVTRNIFKIIQNELGTYESLWLSVEGTHPTFNLR